MTTIEQFAPISEPIPAGLLNTAHIGALIRFAVFDPQTQIQTVITAELRQISHNAAETTINYGQGALGEATFDHDKPIVLGPSPDFDDHKWFTKERI
jgi:hypothetical protein